MPCYDDRDDTGPLYKRIDERTAQACLAMRTLYAVCPNWEPQTDEQSALADWYDGHKRLDEQRAKQEASSIRLMPVKDVSSAMLTELNKRLKGKL